MCVHYFSTSFKFFYYVSSLIFFHLINVFLFNHDHPFFSQSDIFDVINFFYLLFYQVKQVYLTQLDLCTIATFSYFSLKHQQLFNIFLIVSFFFYPAMQYRQHWSREQSLLTIFYVRIYKVLLKNFIIYISKKITKSFLIFSGFSYILLKDKTNSIWDS